MTPSARIPWGAKLKNFPWSSGLRPRGSRRPGFSNYLQKENNTVSELKADIQKDTETETSEEGIKL